MTCWNGFTQLEAQRTVSHAPPQIFSTLLHRTIVRYGLRCKSEIWRVQYTLAKIRAIARTLMTLPEKVLRPPYLVQHQAKPAQICFYILGFGTCMYQTYLQRILSQDPKRIFEGQALLRRLMRLGLLAENETKLDFVLSLTIEKFLDRRLQTRVFQAGLAKSIHHARVLIKQRHIRVGKRLVDVPSFMVRLDSEKHIEFALTSPFGGGRAGRVKRKSDKNKKSDDAGDDEDM